MRVKRHFLSLTLLLLLVGCTGLNPDRYLANKQTYMLSQGNPPSYVAGYIDGCSAGRRLAGDKAFAYRKNNARFDTDALYARGWQEGQINCRNEVLIESSDPERGAVLTPPPGSPVAEPFPTNPQKRAEEMEMQQMWEELKK